MNKFGCGAIGQLPPGGRGGHFPKIPSCRLFPVEIFTYLLKIVNNTS